MDATPAPGITQAQESDQPMSVELLRELIEDNALDIGELSVLLGGLSKSGTYRYTEATELRFGQLLGIFRLAKSDRVREAILDQLLPGSGYQVIKLPESMDYNGDGVVDDQDVLTKTSDAITSSANVIKTLASRDDLYQDTDDWAELMHGQLAKALAAVTAASAAVDHIQAHTPRRKSAKPKLVGGRLAVRRG